MIDDIPATNTTTYTHDALVQLETETKDGVTTNFEYDNHGNITAKGVTEALCVFQCPRQGLFLDVGMFCFREGSASQNI